jgi:hypothetical protein
LQAVTLLVLVGSSVFADTIKPTLDLTALRLEVIWVASNAELAAIRNRYCADPRCRPSSRYVPKQPEGFSVVAVRDGEPECLVVVQRPESVDDLRTLILGHEVLHCLLGGYH